MNHRSLLTPVAVSTLVLAAMAVSAPASARGQLVACPLGRAVDLERPVLPWTANPRAYTRDPLASASLAKPPSVRLRTAVGDGAAVVRVLARTELLCGRGRGELTVRVQRGQAVVSTSGLDPITGECVRVAIERVRFTRVADGTFAHVAIELP